MEQQKKSYWASSQHTLFALVIKYVNSIHPWANSWCWINQSEHALCLSYVLKKYDPLRTSEEFQTIMIWFYIYLLLYTIGFDNLHCLIDHIRSKTKLNCKSLAQVLSHFLSMDILISSTYPSAARLSCLFCALFKFFFWVAVILQYQLAY